MIDRLVADDLAEWDARDGGEPFLIGSLDGKPVTLARHGRNVLVCGQSGSGKSTLVIGLLERIMEREYQICLIDPEGDYENLSGCRTVGDPTRSPSNKEVRQVLDSPESNVVVNMVGVSIADRPNCFASLVTDIQELRTETGRPHWLVIDEAHHVLSGEWNLPSTEQAAKLSNVIFITVHPGHVSPVALNQVNTVIVVGHEPGAILQEFADASGLAVPEVSGQDLQRGQALMWLCDETASYRPSMLLCRTPSTTATCASVQKANWKRSEFSIFADPTAK